MKRQKPDEKIIINQRHFIPGSYEEKKTLFKQVVQSVEIEVSSFCNRVCWFCPNSTHDRKEKKLFIDDHVYTSIIDELASINYDKIISYSGYTEASYDKSFLLRLSEARQKLPDAYLFTCSNGDYLNEQYLKDLSTAGLNEIFVSCYIDDLKRGSYTDSKALTAISKFQKRMGFRLEFKDVAPGSHMYAEAICEELKLVVSVRNHELHANDRGEEVKIVRSKRQTPCSWVFSNVYIDHDGAVKPCCNVRSDIPLHKQYMYGSVSISASLIDIWGGSIGCEWRKDLIGFGDKKSPCTYCYQGAIGDTDDVRKFVENIQNSWINVSRV
jgi:MoaA/NifB/PqqE/SkfB family radical SAM enzyme